MLMKATSKQPASFFILQAVGFMLCLYGIRNINCGCCRELGAKVLIDDNPVYAMECANAGISVLLYDWHLTYPWSKTVDG